MAIVVLEFAPSVSRPALTLCASRLAIGHFSVDMGISIVSLSPAFIHSLFAAVKLSARLHALPVKKRALTTAYTVRVSSRAATIAQNVG